MKAASLPRHWLTFCRWLLPIFRVYRPAPLTFDALGGVLRARVGYPNCALMVSSPIWDGSEKSFNKLYRDRRLLSRSKDFPDFNTARARLRNLVARGGVDFCKAANNIWNVVFAPAPRPTKLPHNHRFVDRADAIEGSKARREIARKILRPMPNHCEACGKIAALQLDHDHKTEALRGWLCGTCNRALGLVHDDIAVLEGLIKYLRTVRSDECDETA